MKVDPRSRRQQLAADGALRRGVGDRRTARISSPPARIASTTASRSGLQGGEVDETDAPLRLQRQVPVRSASAIGVTGWRLITG